MSSIIFSFNKTLFKRMVFNCIIFIIFMVVVSVPKYLDGFIASGDLFKKIFVVIFFAVVVVVSTTEVDHSIFHNWVLFDIRNKHRIALCKWMKRYW